MASVKRIPARALRYRRLIPSFTLIELLIAITIIGIMIGMVLYTLAGARRDAMTARTQGTIKKLNDIVLTRWEEFRYRAVKLSIADDYLIPSQMSVPSTGNPEMIPQLSPREGARLRMIVLRDIMRMEFPDRFNDLTTSPVFYKAVLNTADNYAPFNNSVGDRAIQLDRVVPSTYNSFRKKLGLGALQNPYLAGFGIDQTYSLPGGARPSSPPPPAPRRFPSEEAQSAELLYMIVSSTSFNGANGLESFRPSEIGDTDNDGFPEFIDAWGHPIYWLRWPAGYGVVNAPSSFSAEKVRNCTPPDAIVNDRSVPDPMDPLQTDWRWTHPDFKGLDKPWMLVPLIVSAGADGVFDLKFDFSTPLDYGNHFWTLGGTGSTAHAGGYSFPDPYINFYDTTGTPYKHRVGGLGEWEDGDGNSETFGAQDNITNYGLLLE